MNSNIQLGEIIEAVSATRAGKGDFPILSMTMHNGLVDQSSKFKKRIASEDTSQYKIVARNQLVVGFPIDEGVLSFQKRYDHAIVSPAYGIWAVKRDDVEKSYLEKFLRSPKALRFYSSRLRSTTARRRSLPQDIFLELLVPLPPLSEQRRIVAILNKADALRRKRKRALELLDGMTQSRFVTEFSSENRALVLNDVLQDIDSGWSPTCLDRAASDGEAGVLKLSAITQGWFKASENKAFRSTVSPRARDEVAQGDILFCRKNTRDLIGTSTYIWETPPRLFISDLIFRLVPNRALVEPIYLQAAISTAECRSAISGQSAGSAGSMPNISKSKLREISIPVPNIERQRRFCEFAAVVNAHRQQQIAGLIALESQLASLQHRAFSSQL